MRSAIRLPDALLLLAVTLAASGVSLLYYAFLYPLGAYPLAAIAAASGLVWFATPSTDKS
jgi:hypothetical protein